MPLEHANVLLVVARQVAARRHASLLVFTDPCVNEFCGFLAAEHTRTTCICWRTCRSDGLGAKSFATRRNDVCEEEECDDRTKDDKGQDLADEGEYDCGCEHSRRLPT